MGAEAEVIMLLTKRQEGGSPARMIAIETKLQQYPPELVVRMQKEMAGPPPEPESLADQEDFVLLWQEQLLSARSELKAVINTQRTFQTGLKGLAEKVPQLVGELPMDLLADIEKNISEADKALEEVKTHEKRLAELRNQIKEWGKTKKPGGGELKEQADALASMKETVLPELAKRMKAADDQAVDMQTKIIDQVTSACREVASRLQMESEKGWGSTYATVKNYSEYVFGGVGWFVSTLSLDLIPKSKITTLNVAVQSLVNLAKETHVGINAGGDKSSLDNLLSSMGPLSAYRANLIKYKDWFSAGLDLGGLTGLLPLVGEALADSLDKAKGIMEAVLDGQLDRVQKLDDELKSAYEELKKKGTPTAEEIEKLKQRALSSGDDDLDAIWDGLKDQAKKFQDSWIKISGETFGKMWEGAVQGWTEGSQQGIVQGLQQGVVGGVTGTVSGLKEKVYETVRNTIIRLVSELFPKTRPQAMFGFEISDVIKTLVVDNMTDFTEEEKNELAALSA